MKTLITLLIATFFYTSKAQTKLAYNNCELKAITIGEKIPEQIWNRSFAIINHPKPITFLKLSEYGNKLIILDLWATNCHPCIESLDLLDSLNKEFKDDLIVIPVLMNDRIEKAHPFMIKKGYKWPCIVGDTTIGNDMMKDYSFSGGTIWIKDGRLLAAPKKQSVTAENIHKAIKGDPIIFALRTLTRQRMAIKGIQP
jgi:thiol-disulfide isomerase/thioredoxin